MNRHSPPDLAKISARLASNNDRVSRYLDMLPQRMDELIDAMQADDWHDVHRISQYLLDSSRTYGQSLLEERAEEVCRSMHNRGDRLQLKRHVIRLISACGASR